MHDFAIPDLGKPCRTGSRTSPDNAGWFNLGVSHNTAAFVVESGLQVTAPIFMVLGCRMPKRVSPPGASPVTRRALPEEYGPSRSG